MNIKNRIIHLLMEMERGKYSNILLNEYLSEYKYELQRKEKAFITEVFYGVIRNMIFLDYQIDDLSDNVHRKWLRNMLRLSMYQIYYMESDDAGVVWEATELTKEKLGDHTAKFVNAILRNFIRRRELIEDELRDAGKIDILYSYPKWLVNKFMQQVVFRDKIDPKSTVKESGDATTGMMERLEDVLRSYKSIPSVGVRLNLAKYSVEEFEEFLLKNDIQVIHEINMDEALDSSVAVSGSDAVTKNNGRIGKVYYLSSGGIINTREFREGKIIIQDAASVLAGVIVGAKPGELVLDSCSAPGSKTNVIASTMENTGRVIALDIHKHKVRLIRRGAARAGIDIVEAYNLDARLVGEKLAEVIARTDTDGATNDTINDLKFDRILVDAPCSGYGVIRKKPEIVYNKDGYNIDELATLQYEILSEAARNLKTGGELVYSTCTIFKEENTDNVLKFLRNNPEFTVIDMNIPDGINGEYDDIGGFLVNHREKYLDGFYIIKFIKK